MKTNRPLLLTSIVLCAFTFTGCATTETGEPNRAANGALIGAIAGAVLGAQVDDDDGNKTDGVLLGAAAGAAAGAGIGAMMDRQQREFEAELAEEQRQNEIEIERIRDDLLKVTFDSEVTFGFDSADINPGFHNSLTKVADVLIKYGSKATVVGHTDSTGSESYNQQLSERRATQVRNFFLSRGVNSAQVEALGRGEMEPRASNETEAGRQLNRRVELFVTPSNS